MFHSSLKLTYYTTKCLRTSYHQQVWITTLTHDLRGLGTLEKNHIFNFSLNYHVTDREDNLQAIKDVFGMVCTKT